MGNVWQDFAYAVRTLLKKPGYSVAAILPLALGIGATSAIFSVVYAVMMRPLPYDNPETIVQVWETRPRMRMRHRPGAGAFTMDHFREWRDHNTVFEHIAAYGSQAEFNLTGTGEPLRISGTNVSPDLFPMLGVSPVMGRNFSPEEETPGKDRVILLHYRTWQTLFGADRDIVGTSLRLDGQPYTVIGVMPEGFDFPEGGPEFWAPLALRPSQPGVVEMIPVIARLKPGVTIEQAEAEAQALIARLRQETSEGDPRHQGVEVHLGSMQEQMISPVRPALWVLLAAVGLVLLIVCTNVANLLLSQAVGREKEVAVRAALGAGRFRLIRQMLTESLVLGLVGGGLGLALAYWGVRLLVRLNPGNIPRLGEVSIDSPVLLFTLGVAVVTALVFGAVPALRTSRVDLHRSLKEGAETHGLGLLRRARGRSVFAVAEIALALVLLVSAGLMIQSFVRLIQVDSGYDPRDTLTLSVNLPRSKYREATVQKAFFDQVLERTHQLSGVQKAGIVNVLPLSRARFVMGLQIQGRPPVTRHEDMPRADFRLVSPGYFQAMGIPLKKGRLFSEQDGPGTQPVAVINQALADTYFPDDDPIGQRFQFGEIVGVVGDVRSFGLDAEPSPEVYLSYEQATGRLASTLSGMYLIVRSRGVDPLSLVPEIRSIVLAVDPEMPIDDVLTMEQRLSNSVAGPRFYAVLLGLFGALALILAISGIYGVVSYSVSRRTAETGIRMALGAKTGDIIKMVLGEGMLLAVVGVGGGLAASVAATRLLSGLLFGVTANDIATYAGVAVLLCAIALLACYVPARRASRVDPVDALRYE
jgi:putative ABC transport system permease protein